MLPFLYLGSLFHKHSLSPLCICIMKIISKQVSALQIVLAIKTRSPYGFRLEFNSPWIALYLEKNIPFFKKWQNKSVRIDKVLHAVFPRYEALGIIISVLTLPQYFFYEKFCSNILLPWKRIQECTTITLAGKNYLRILNDGFSCNPLIADIEPGILCMQSMPFTNKVVFPQKKSLH